jgi:uncharacterized protein YjbI with pentapeptide repeats
MTRSLFLQLGLVAGCLAGLGFYGVGVVRRVVEFRPAYQRVAAVAAVSHSRAFAANGTELQPHSRTPRPRLVGQDRTNLHIPHGDYNTFWLERVDFRGTDLHEAEFRQSWILECDFRDANMEHADLTDATIDELTLWPEGFDPRAHGATLTMCRGRDPDKELNPFATRYVK